MPHTTKKEQTEPRIAAIAELVEAKQLTEAEALYQDLKAEAQAAPKDLARAQAQAQAAVKIILGLGLGVKLGDVQDYFQDVRDLASAWPKDAAIALERANASYRLIYHHGTAKQPDQAAALHAELRGLAQAHPDDSRFALAQAKGAVNLISAYADASKPDQAQAVYDELKTLAQRHPGNAEIALEQADGAYNLLCTYADASKPDQAQAVYNELKDLAESNPGNADFALVQAQGANNLISAYAKASKPDQAQAVYDELKALAESNPGNAEIALAQAKGTVNLINAYGDASKPDQAQAVYDELKELVQGQPGTAEMALRQAKGAVNLINAYAKASKPDQAQAVYDELKALAQGHPGNAEIALEQAKGAVNLINAYSNASKSDQAQAVYNELKDMAESNPGNAEIALLQASGAVNLTKAYANTSKPDQAQAVYDELKALAESNPGNAEITLQKAKGAFNLGASYHRVNKGGKALLAFKEAEALCAPLTAPEAQEFRTDIDRALLVLRMTAQEEDAGPKQAAKPPKSRAKAGPPAKDGAQAPATKQRAPFSDELNKVIRPLKDVKDAFTKEMEARRQRVKEFLKDESLFAPQASVLLVLRKWNSFTPIIMDGQESDRGGGYFLFHKGVGLVIDPGYDFIEQFHEAGGQIRDITHIAITHAHDDHTAQLEQLLTMLHQYNKEREKEKKKEKRKQVTLLLNHSAMKKFSGFRLHRDCSYVERVVCLNAFDKDAPAQKVRLDADGELEMTVLPAYHDDVFSAKYAVGLGFTVRSGENRRVLVLTSDTGLYPPKLNADGKVETYEDGEKMVCEDQPKLAIHKLYPEPFNLSPDLLIPHIGSIKEYEFDPQPDSNVPIYYPNHLGFLGTAKLLRDTQPKAVILSEFGSELKNLRMKIASLLLKALDKDPFIIPGDNTLVYDFATGWFLSHSDCQFHPQADIEPRGLAKKEIGLFLKVNEEYSLDMFRASKKQLRDPHRVEDAGPLPYMRKPQA